MVVTESLAEPGKYSAHRDHEFGIVMLPLTLAELRDLYGAIGTVLQAHDHDGVKA